MSDGELTGRVAAVAAALTELGVRRKEQVLIMMPDGAGFIDAFVGTVELDAVPLPVNPALPVGYVVTIAAEADARLIVVSAQLIPALAALAAEPPRLLDGPAGPWAAVLRLD